MYKIFRFFYSFWMSYLLLAIYAISCMIATFIENDFSIQAAKNFIYNALWFEILHVLLALNLIINLFVFRLWQRKKAVFLLHISFLIILFGAFLTRYYGKEGIMHIRENESSNKIISVDNYISLFVYNNNKIEKEYNYLVFFEPNFDNNFEKNIILNGKKLILEFIGYEDKQKSIIKIQASYDNDTKIVMLMQNYDKNNIAPFSLAKKTFALNWGPIDENLPFYVRLNDFILKRYAGSSSPSSYLSDISIVKNNSVILNYKIFMNNVLDYDGYRFFQSSYDKDEEGTILTINKDLGKIPTYIGYALLIISFLWTIFSKKGRFYKLFSYLKEQKILNILLVCFLLFSTKIFANDEILKLISKMQTNSKEHFDKFSYLLIEDFNGRIKPIDTLSLEFMHKITKSNNFLNLNHNQLFLAMMLYPKEFKNIKMFPIKNNKLKQIIGISKSEKKIAYNDLIYNNNYKLANYIEEANRKKPFLRDEFDKEVLALDEKINLAFLIYSGKIFKIFPDPNKTTNAWISNEANLSNDVMDEIYFLLGSYFFNLHNAIISDKWEYANDSLQKIIDFQNIYAKDKIPSQNRIKAEVFLNKYNIFDNLSYVYLFCGILLFLIILFEIITNKTSNKIKKIIYFIIFAFAFLHFLALSIRWYIGDHAPWSNAYESMIYIAFSCVMASLIFFSKSFFVLAISSILAGICLFVAHLGFMDPQITNLVPVLKSYWLNIHVSIITASYGFLAICFMIGLFVLVLFIFRRKDEEKIKNIILNLNIINEMSMIIGLAMLTIGNFLGGVWANESWGRYWGWDPKETWALISIVIYALILHLRFVKILNNAYVFSCASVLGFYSILMTYFGVNYYLSGLHSYAKGDLFDIPWFVVVFIGFTFLLIFLSFFKRKPYISFL